MTIPLVEGVDHVYVPMAQAQQAFAVLTDDLRLPVMWPFRSFGSFASGGVSVGSIKLEIIEPSPQAPWSTPQSPPQIQGIAFRAARPVNDAFLAEVDARAIAHAPPVFFERDGKPGWTNLYFTDFISPAAGVFVCDYHLPESRDLTRRRQLLRACGGGRLGVEDAVELVIGTTEPGAAQQRWQRLFDPQSRGRELTWPQNVGPAIRLLAGDDDRVDHLVLAVRDAAAAQQVWHDFGLPKLGLFPLRFVDAQRAMPS